MTSTPNQYLKEARSQQALGFLNDASRQFDLALSQDPDNILLVVMAAGNKMRQRLLGEAHAILSAQQARMEKMIPELNQLHVAVFDIFMALSTCNMTGKFKEPLSRALQSYTTYAMDKPVESFNKHVVAITGLYHTMLSLVNIMGYQAEMPLPSIPPDFRSMLVYHLMSEKRYDDAIMMAKIGDFSYQPVGSTSLLKSILAEQDLSDLQRAEVLCEYGDCLRLISGNGRAAWQESLNTAADLFNRAGHATGALDVHIDLMQSDRRDSASVVDDTAKLWQIMTKMESVGNWESVHRCLRAIIAVNTEGSVTLSESLRAKIEEEWLRVADLCSRGAEGESVAVFTITDWQSYQPRTAKGVEWLERFYNMAKDCDAPNLISIILTQLFEIYHSIGDEAKAIDCLSRRPAALPRHITCLLGLGPFETALNAATEAPDTEAEVQNLRDELQEVQGIIRRSPTVDARAIEVQRLGRLCQKYILQHTFRPHHQIERLVDCFEPVVEEGCQTLDDWQATIGRATALQGRAWIPQIKSSQTAKTVEEMRAFAVEALQYYQRALDLYDASEHSQDWRALEVKGNVANRLDLLWQLAQKPAVSDDFTNAASLYAQAAGSVFLKSQQSACLNLLRLWVAGHEAKVVVDGTIFQTSSSYEMALKWANEADRLETVQRNDLSSLPRERAVLAKQLMRSQRDATSDFHMIAMVLQDSVGDYAGAWAWLQRSKARSISDMLGLGVNIPQALRYLIDADPDLVSMCDSEQNLTREISAAPEDRQFLLRTKLEAHRTEMRQVPLLKQLLDYREGQPTSLQRLQSINVGTPAESARGIIYVDWVVYADRCWVFMASSTGVDRFLAGMTGTEVAQWKAQYLGDGSAETHPLDLVENDLVPLQKLSKLIQGVLTRTEPKDILVFCPSGVLHGVPLHAATLSDDSEQSLLERNPVVYTASMTTFEQCVSNEAERELLSNDVSRSYIAVYERTETDALTISQMKERDSIYAKVQGVAARCPLRSSTAFGSEVTRERLVAAFEADYMYFFGHCESSSTNMLHQGLVLDDPARGHRDLFTASDIFAIDVKTSCVTLLACGSAHEMHGQGDEPLGIVSALLCAGATSVIGTMWKVQVGTAGVFTDVLDRHLNKGNGALVDLAVAVQESALRLKRRRGEGGTYRPYHWAAFVLHGSWFMSRRDSGLDLGSLSLVSK